MIVNPAVWYSEREIDFVPIHFVKCPTPVNSASIHYIQNKTLGRYAFASDSKQIQHVDSTVHVYFEDQRDATVYELIWAGSTQ